MTESDEAASFRIIGQTADGSPFRPSDWAERLCGVMSPYRPRRSLGGHLTYSPYVMPGLRNGLKTVTVDARLFALEPLAWRFIAGFARENGLCVEPVAAPAEVAANQAATGGAGGGPDNRIAPAGKLVVVD